MQCEVIVIGAGIGGLTTAALLAARGVNVCLLERQSRVGGCAASIEHLGYTFEPTFGLYSGWERGGTWDRIFSELPVTVPNVTRLFPNYIVRLPDGRDIAVSSDGEAFAEAIAVAFSDCADAALHFVRGLKSGSSPVADMLIGTSRAFRWFIDAQLQIFAQCTSDKCTASQATDAIRMATGELWSIDEGAQALVDRLAQSFKISGGVLRLDSPVLRLAYDTGGTPAGVDLLNGERVTATRAIVSNLTIWDTYGKLVGPSRTPRAVAIELKKLSSWGAYLMFLAIDEDAVTRLPSRRTLLTFDGHAEDYDPQHQQLSLNVAGGLMPTAPHGKRALTALAFTEAEEWFSFHEDHAWLEERDQAVLESWWAKIHQALPQLGDSVEVIETNTPQDTYETYRRRFGMIGAPNESPSSVLTTPPFPNLFQVSDTTCPTSSLEQLALSGRTAADQITK